MLTKKEIDRIAKYTDGVAEPGEMKWIEDLFADGQGNTNLKNHLKDDWKNFSQESIIEDKNLDHILDRVHHSIRKKESQSKKSKTIFFRFSNLYVKAAAILLLPLLVAGGIYIPYLQEKNAGQQGTSEIYAPMGARVAFHLPDGTSGWLNSGSTLTYSLPFVKNRNVALSGEAWFDVFHDEKRPFEIVAGKSNIRVLGTSFNLRAYPDEEYLELILQEGKVEFATKAQTGKIVLKPSQQLTLRNGMLNINTVDVLKYKAWTNGELIFRGDDMAEVARRIERWYNVDVEIADEHLSQFSFRATFENETLEDILEQLSMTSPISYKIVPRKQLPDGTSERKKVILNKKST